MGVAKQLTYTFLGLLAVATNAFEGFVVAGEGMLFTSLLPGVCIRACTCVCVRLCAFTALFLTQRQAYPHSTLHTNGS